LTAWWSPEHGNSPTSVTITRIPSREIVKQRSFFNVEDCKLSWHPDGSFLAVLAAKAHKKKKPGQQACATETDRAKGSLGYAFEVFRLKDKKDNAVEVMEIPHKVVDFSWEPNGSRFALIAGEGPAKYTISVYNIPDKGQPVLLYTLTDKPYSTAVWSPRGDHLVFATSGGVAGTLEFYDANPVAAPGAAAASSGSSIGAGQTSSAAGTASKESTAASAHVSGKSFGTAEHPGGFSGIKWDPSGRIVATFKTQKYPGQGEITIRDTVDNGYILWSFQGARIADMLKPKLYQFLWRPRPDTILTDEEVTTITKGLKKYMSKHMEEDRRAEERKLTLERLRKLRRLLDFRSFLESRHKAWLADREERIHIGAEDPQDEYTLFEEIVEAEVELKVEVVA
jgi:translation initiation factor 3 subunit B